MLRRARLISGIILMVFVASHLVNHAAGLVSLQAMESGRAAFIAVWRSLPGSLALYGAIAVHVALAFWAIYQRRSLRMTFAEAAQLGLGLAIVPLLALHVAGTRGGAAFAGAEPTYGSILLIYFELAPTEGYKQAFTTLVVWLHGCLGLHLWLRFRPVYRRMQPYLLVGAVVLPLIGLLGAWSGGQEVLRLSASGAWAAEAEILRTLNQPERLRIVGEMETATLATFALLLLATALARIARYWFEHRGGQLKIGYPDGSRATLPKGGSILDASRLASIPHASLCGGRGRCSTCRVRVGLGGDRLPPPSAEESRVLARVGAAPNVRLACQTRPTADVEVTPLLSAGATRAGRGAGQAVTRQGHSQGEEREIAILFADLRGFTRIAEHKLPYDVVFLLNRYFQAMGDAVEQAGGRVDKFIGDGVMALFGIGAAAQSSANDGSLAALRAARGMAEQLVQLNRALDHDLSEPLRIGIGIHVGPVIVGEMGSGQATSLTAIGDAVNTASRLEAATKDFGAQLVVSAEVAKRAGADLSFARPEQIRVRGRERPLDVWVVEDALKLPL